PAYDPYIPESPPDLPLPHITARARMDVLIATR
ncbi:hypothetical protein A2U01_0039164, partial [Trifolium medium]|nr:hypothetical protein [Trifolium medium]